MEAPTSSSFFLEETPMTIETSFDSNYRKVLVAARRARQLQNGSQALVPTRSNKACRIAQDEINAGKISYVKNNEAEVTKPLVEGPAVPILLSKPSLFPIPPASAGAGVVLPFKRSARLPLLCRKSVASPML